MAWLCGVLNMTRITWKNNEKHVSKIFNADCPRCGSDDTFTDFEFGNKKCFNCGERWDGGEHTIHS